MSDLPPIANFISNGLIILLLITFAYAIYIRIVPDDNIYELTDHPSALQYNQKKNRNNRFLHF